jgi:uncharacterized protein
MIIKYTNFSDGIHQFTLDESVEKLGLENLFFGRVVVDCRMDKSLHQIVLNCESKAKAKLSCDRCGNQFEEELKSNFQISYLFTRDSKAEDSYNVKYLSNEEDKINISKDVFEYSELAIPLKKLCRDDCKGLCSVCGADLNIVKCECHVEKVNDIWEPLKKLKLKTK